MSLLAFTEANLEYENPRVGIPSSPKTSQPTVKSPTTAAVELALNDDVGQLVCLNSSVSN